MHDDEWDALALVLDQWWPGRFDVAADRGYRMALDAYDPDQVAGALQALLRTGGDFRPKVREIVALIESDPDEPTFEEAAAAIWGANGILRARPDRRLFTSEADRFMAEDDAAMAAAARCHPLIAGFVASQGVRRLRTTNIDDPDYGTLRRKELREAFDGFRENTERREALRLIAGGGRRRGGELRKLDVLGALGHAPAAELTTGDAA